MIGMRGGTPAAGTSKQTVGPDRDGDGRAMRDQRVRGRGDQSDAALIRLTPRQAAGPLWEEVNGWRAQDRVEEEV